MPTPVKEFVLTHVIDDIQQLTTEDQVSNTEEHFGIPWRMSFFRNSDGEMVIFLNCLMECTGDWSVETEYELKFILPKSDALSSRRSRLFSKKGYMSWGWSRFSNWDKLQEYYSVNGKITLEAHVKILKMTECGKEKLRSFDDPELSDVVLVVQDKKFHVLKKYLALQSTYFKALFLGNFDEFKQSEVVLKDVNSADFQNFLQLIHGESSIDDITINGILHLADMYDAPTAIRRCEEFLLLLSKKTRVQKLQISVQYKLEKLKEKCLSEIKTVDDIRSVVKAKLDVIDLSISHALSQKLLSLN